jgi:hypothetical protein
MHAYEEAAAACQHITQLQATHIMHGTCEAWLTTACTGNRAPFRGTFVAALDCADGLCRVTARLAVITVVHRNHGKMREYACIERG